MAYHRVLNIVLGMGKQDTPLRLKCLVKVPPYPGTGQSNFASVSILPAVAVVKMLGLLTVVAEVAQLFKGNSMSVKFVPVLRVEVDMTHFQEVGKPPG